MFTIAGWLSGNRWIQFVLWFTLNATTIFSRCAVAENKGTQPKQHKCFKNWNGSSCGMESDMIVVQDFPKYKGKGKLTQSHQMTNNWGQVRYQKTMKSKGMNEYKEKRKRAR